jgi:hypothetical protein
VPDLERSRIENKRAFVLFELAGAAWSVPKTTLKGT